jgi:8-oxo-dGTP pyrophosphatase MutT (NUDIX family)
MLDIDPKREGTIPLPAATVILLRDGDRGVEIFMVQRHRKLQFMGGATVFPGGKLDASDADAALLTQCDLSVQEAARALDEAATPEALALFVAAIRETFEESGVLLGEADGARDLDALRVASSAPNTFGPMVLAEGIRLQASRMVPLSRWVTPVVEKRRFDARFFLAKVEPGTNAAHDHAESIAGAWLTAAEAIGMHEQAEIDLPPPTLRTLELLSPFARADDALADARNTKPRIVPPVFCVPDGDWVLALPGDPLHPDPGPVIGGPTRFTAKDARWFSG